MVSNYGNTHRYLKPYHIPSDPFEISTISYKFSWHIMLMTICKDYYSAKPHNTTFCPTLSDMIRKAYSEVMLQTV